MLGQLHVEAGTLVRKARSAGRQKSLHR